MACNAMLLCTVHMFPVYCTAIIGKQTLTFSQATLCESTALIAATVPMQYLRDDWRKSISVLSMNLKASHPLAKAPVAQHISHQNCYHKGLSHKIRVYSSWKFMFGFIL